MNEIMDMVDTRRCLRVGFCINKITSCNYRMYPVVISTYSYTHSLHTPILCILCIHPMIILCIAYIAGRCSGYSIHVCSNYTYVYMVSMVTINNKLTLVYNLNFVIY